jgi:hypothetical protein
LGTLAVPILFYGLYSTWFAAWLEHTLEHTNVTTAFRDPGEYATWSVAAATGVAEGFVYAAQGLLGNPWDGYKLGCVAAAVLLLCAARLSRRAKAASRTAPPPPIFAWFETAGAVACLGVMYTAMSLRHPPLLWRSIMQGGYYYQPLCLLFLLLAAATPWVRQLFTAQASRAWAAVALLVISAGNYAATSAIKEVSLAEVIKPEVREQKQPVVRAVLFGGRPLLGQSVNVSSDFQHFLTFFVEEVPTRSRGIALAH